MSIKKAAFAAAMGTLLMSSAVLAELEVTPYGAAQYRLRFEQTMFMPEEGDNVSMFDYSNRLCLRMGLRAKWDDKFSMQFQIGNDWGAAENVEVEGNGDRSVRNGQRLYTQLAFFRYNPGAYFIEAGIVPLNGHGALEFMEGSLTRGAGTYNRAIFNGWGDMNASLPGIKLGMPILKDDFKLGVELTHSITRARTQSRSEVNNDGDPQANPSGIMTVLQLPMSSGDFRITPEMVIVFNREVGVVDGDRVGDHEMAFGAAGSYKINDNVSLTFRGGYAMFSDDNRTDGSPTTAPNGFLVGAGTSIRGIGPGTLQFSIDYSGTDDAERDNADRGHLYTDLRYAMRLHPRVTFTPRYRTYTTMTPDVSTNLVNRFELILEGSF